LQNNFQSKTAQECKDDLDLRVYTSNLLGANDELVLHGGGNTSVKMKQNKKDILYVKGSGWDLSSIRPQGFAPVALDALLEMAELESLRDGEMVGRQKAAMTDKKAPNPSVEAILHALIPFKFVDHTHADAVVTISNSKNGEKYIKELFANFLIVPYVMPGFVLARTIYEMTREMDWKSCEGIILHHHGIFTFDDDAEKSYAKMIDAVSKAEDFLNTNAALTLSCSDEKALDLQALQRGISKAKGYDAVLHVNSSDLAFTYASQENLKTFASQGVLTPEHIIRTKRIPLVLELQSDIAKEIAIYEKEYAAYFEANATDEIALNPAPNYAVIKDFGVVTFGKDAKEAGIINDIVEHTMLAVLRAEKLGGYKSIGIKESFAMEYWELEQAKLRR
jgi:rhamnose utilization protein RhaD (predicted bifunctional aldolase and dehydrogenase)